MKLPNPENAIIDSEKLVGVSTQNTQTDDTKPLYSTALDLDLDDAEELRTALLQAVATYDAIPTQRNSYGQKFIIVFS